MENQLVLGLNFTAALHCGQLRMMIMLGKMHAKPVQGSHIGLKMFLKLFFNI